MLHGKTIHEMGSILSPPRAHVPSLGTQLTIRVFLIASTICSSVIPRLQSSSEASAIKSTHTSPSSYLAVGTRVNSGAGSSNKRLGGTNRLKKGLRRSGARFLGRRAVHAIVDGHEDWTNDTKSNARYQAHLRRTMSQ